MALKNPKNLVEKRKGAMLILICIMIFAFLATVAMSVDIAYMNLVKSELRSATDAAAKAAAEHLARTQDVAGAIDRGQEIASQNFISGRPLTLEDSDFSFGQSTPLPSGRFQFTSGGSPTNSVRVNAELTRGSATGSVRLFFGQLLGRDIFEPTEASTATFIERDVVLVVDRSGSMLDDNKWNNLLAAVDVFNATLKTNPVDVQLGLASYSTNATIDVNLTTNTDLVPAALRRRFPSGTTSISRGMDAGLRIIRASRPRQFVDRTMVVMTDGIHNAGRDPILSAREVVAEGVKIHAITFGRDADVRRMQNIASIGGGLYRHATNATQLTDAFREIALTLNTI